MMKAGSHVVTCPLDLSQVVAPLHVGVVGHWAPVSWEGWKEAPCFEITDLEHKATPTVRDWQRGQKLCGPIGQSKEELRLNENRWLVDGATLGGAE